MLVIKNDFSPFDIFLSSEMYSPCVSPVMHQAIMGCNSVLAWGIAIRACIFGVVLNFSSEFHNTTGLRGRLTNWQIVSACISEEPDVPYASVAWFCLV